MVNEGICMLTIRDITASDEADWRELWAQYLAFYKVAIPPAVTDATFARLLDPASALFGRVAICGDRVIGFAISLTYEATWAATPVCYLEDLFVNPAERGTGVGRALLQDLVDMAKQRGWSRLEWHTVASNVVARRLYDQFVQADDHVRYRMILVTGS